MKEPEKTDVPKELTLENYLQMIGADKNHAAAMTIWLTLEQQGYRITKDSKELADLRAEYDKVHERAIKAERESYNTYDQLNKLEAERDKLKEENERLILDANKDLSTMGGLMQDVARLKKKLEGRESDLAIESEYSSQLKADNERLQKEVDRLEFKLEYGRDPKPGE